jgi:hypothetical protein
MMYEYIFVYIVLSLIIIIKIINFFVGNIFSIFFHVHLNILDKVVSSLYAIFGTLCSYRSLITILCTADFDNRFF